MSITSIIIAVALFVIGIGLGWALWGRKKASEPQEDTGISASSLPVVDESVLAEKDEQLHKAQGELNDLRVKIDELKRKRSAIQMEKEKRIGELEVQLRNATEGKIDEPTLKRGIF